MAYAKIEERIWSDRRRRALPEDARWFLLYLETCPHRNRLGLFVLDPLYAAADVQWPPDRAEAALESLEDAELIGRDPETRLVLIYEYLADNPLANANVVKAAIRNDLTSLPATPLAEALLECVENYSRDHYTDLITALRARVDENGATTPHQDPPPNRSPNGSPNGIAKGGYTPAVTKPIPKPEPEPEKEPTGNPTTSPAAQRLEEWLGEPQAIDAARALAADTGNPQRWCLGFMGSFGPSGTEERLLRTLPSPAAHRRAIGITLTRYLSEGKPYEARLFRAFLRRVVTEENRSVGAIPGTEAAVVARRPEPGSGPRRMIHLSAREGGGLLPIQDLLPSTGS